MRFDFALLGATLLSGVHAAVIDPRHPLTVDSSPLDGQDLFKRKGGGASGARGGGGGSSSSSSGGSSGGARGGSGSGSGASGSSGGFRGNTGAASTAGGTSRGGTGPPRSYGGGGFYGGGAALPFAAGLATASGIAAIALVASALTFWPGRWDNGAYLYPHRDEYSFFNATTDRQESLPVVCGCAQYAECGCDDNNSAMKDLVGNGTYAALNKSVIDVGDYNGRKSFLVNATLPNGTTADGPDQDSAAAGMHNLVQSAGLWPAVACVLAVIFMT